MTLKANEIVSILEKEIGGAADKAEAREVGRVLEVGDGIARVYGLAGVMAGEMVEFTRAKVRGLAFNLEENSVGIIILGDYLGIEEGDEVVSTGDLLAVPCGEALLGRVVDPLGNPLDGKGPIVTKHSRPVESPAPGVADRQPVKQPLQTGIKAIDAMTPVGRGQRELIIGDRKTGKTAIAIDAIINQKKENVICVYVAIGQKEATVARIVEDLRRNGAMDYTIVVSASSASPAPLQYIAPYAGCAMAEYFMYAEGRDTLCVYDDLSKQAAAYRQLSLLMRRPPGREAFPGDIFYAHSRLLERSCKVAERYVIVPESADVAKVTEDWSVVRTADNKPVVYVGVPGAHEAKEEVKKRPGHKVAKVPSSGGSLTALPIIETLEGEVSAYIPTNVISITDGQIYLQPDLFYAGVRPAIDVGISVSRVGGNAQIKAMKSIAGGLRLDLAAFRALEAFAQLGTELDPVTQRDLDRGYRMVEILKQGLFKPMDVIDQVMILFAGNKGHLDKVDVKHVAAWEEQFLRFMREQKAEVRALLEKHKDITFALEKKKVKEMVEGKEVEKEVVVKSVADELTAAIKAFQPQFKAPTI